MSFDSLTNRGEYLSAHYLSAILPATLKTGLLKRWSDEEKAGRRTPRAGLRGLRRDYFAAKAELADAELFGPERLRKLHAEILTALGFTPSLQTITVERAGRQCEVTAAYTEPATGHGILAIEGGWATDTDAAHDPTDAGRLLDPVTVDGTETIETSAKLASWLFATEDPPRYVLILNGGVVTLADRTVWGEGRYLAVSLDLAFGRNDDRELDVIAALFGADSLRPPAEGGTEPLADLVAGSRQHAVGVSSELREGLRISVELIANEVLDRIRQESYLPQDVMDLDDLAKELGREALRYLYRILFLLYAEARPELGVLPVDDPEYASGYSLTRLGDLIARQLPPSSEGGFHLYESLDLLFRMVNGGHRPRGGEALADKASEDVGLRFEPMRSDLFLPSAIKLIGRQIPEPGSDPDDPDGPRLDTRLRNATLYRVLRLLMLTKGAKKQRGGFISYAQLGINQLGAVYEGLMSYTGFVATEQLYEVAKHGDPKDGSWMIPASKVDEYDDTVFVVKENPITGVRSRVSYEPGSFVYRLAGRDRQTSASYYTPQSLTEVTVQLALRYRLDQDGTVTPARELLDWTICEPALGSGAFLNEAINQVAAEYLRRRQDELKVALEPEEYHFELQRTKAYIALHNCYGVDLNRTAVELAEVSLWLNVMHAGLQAPWFGLHLRRGNSLIGGRRQTYTPAQLVDKSWLTTAPKDQPFRDGPIDEGSIHHFLLPADGWGAAAGEKEARELAPVDTDKLKKWRSAMKRVPSARGKSSQVARLQALARRVEFLWDLVQQRLEISEREIRRGIPVWAADDLPLATGAVPREKILADLETVGTPYWRLKTLMDVWCALWFWPLEAAGLLDGTAEEYTAGSVEVSHVKELPVYEEPTVYERVSLFEEVEPQQLKLPTKTGSRKVTVAEQLRKQVALTDLDDWLTFAEALIGRADIPKDSLISDFATLPELGEFETKLPGLTGMDESYRLTDRFPWLRAAVSIAEQQGFLHWELAFAQAFATGGFDIQVGNPPWVRPAWDEGGTLSEYDAWFGLAERPSTNTWRQRRAQTLSIEASKSYFLDELGKISAMSAYYSAPPVHDLLAGTQPNLYRAFMLRTWRSAGEHGAIGLVHPDTHFDGANEGPLRAAAYARLKVHADFMNVGNKFFPPPVSRRKHFGVHIYGSPGDVDFLHLSWLFDTGTLTASLRGEGSGPAPGIKYLETWDMRPHPSRVVRVNESVLARWRTLSGEAESPLAQTRLLYPITDRELEVIEVLAAAKRLVGAESHITSGFHEKGAKEAGVIGWATYTPETWSDVVLQGPNIGIGTPFHKKPNIPCRNNLDYTRWDPRSVGIDEIPRTNYRRMVDRDRFDKVQDIWAGKTYSNYYRVAWRDMVPSSNERSLFASLIPPGATHVHTVRSMFVGSNRMTALVAGFWAALPLDYILRITGHSKVGVSEARSMPCPTDGHPLADALLVRILRLSCLTSEFSPLWGELFRESWSREGWAVSWPQLPSLGSIHSDWSVTTPLRTEFERRAALVEIDALVSVWLGITAEQLCTFYASQFPVMREFEDYMWFDANGQKIAREFNAYGHGQTKEHYEQLGAHLGDPERRPAPKGYAGPFYKADREGEYFQAHAVFSKLLRDAIDAGREPS